MRIALLSAFLVFVFPLHAQHECTCCGVDRTPEFPGGTAALKKYIAEHLIYPETAARAGIEGKVWISFRVDTSLFVSSVTIVRGLHPDCDAAAVEAICSLPKWQTSFHVKPVSCTFRLPIVFELKDGQ